MRDVTANFEVQKPAWRPWLPEQPTMSQVSLVKAERARQNRAYVRGLLTRRQPGFAAALASADRINVLPSRCQLPAASQLIPKHPEEIAA